MFLDKIRKIKEEEIIEQKKPERDLLEKISQKSFFVIAEIKKASPSKGDINPKADVLDIAKGYLSNGASILSVLTEKEYFKGDISYIKKIRKIAPDALILRKDFIIDSYQIYEAKFSGADMVLIILGLVGYKKACELINLAHSIGLETLVEVHSEKEMKEALKTKSNFIGVNNRNLKTLEVSLDVSRKLSKYIDSKRVFICESGIDNSSAIKEMMTLGYKGFLIGSYFMKEKDPALALKNLINEVERDD